MVLPLSIHESRDRIVLSMVVVVVVCECDCFFFLSGSWVRLLDFATFILPVVFLCSRSESLLFDYNNLLSIITEYCLQCMCEVYA